MIIASIPDFREAARRRLPRFLFEYIDGGSYAEVTLKRNVEDLAGIALRQRVLRDVSNIDLSTELFGRKLALPVLLSSLHDPPSSPVVDPGCPGGSVDRLSQVVLQVPRPIPPAAPVMGRSVVLTPCRGIASLA